MPSTQTRTKLKAFQFIEGVPTLETAKQREAEKENLPSVLEAAVKSRETPKASKISKDLATEQKTPKPPTIINCPPPSTPATTRLPLADLVGNIDDSSRHAPQPVASPEEQLIWRGSQPVNTPLPRKNKKRARSSSPPGPSQEEQRNDSAKKDLTTPQADPAMELWSRYTSNRGTPSANKSVAFAHLIDESSPRSAAAAGSVSGLRRWASCGVEFPASHRKRKRTHGVFQGDKEHTEDIFTHAPSSDGTMAGQSVKPNLASMVQRMRECVTKSQPRVCSQLPSSSSPLPDGEERQLLSSGSPLQRGRRDKDLNATGTLHDEDHFMDDAEQFGHEHVESNSPREQAPQEEQSYEPNGSPDEFGDDDFDSDVVNALEISPQPAEGTTQDCRAMMPDEPEERPHIQPLVIKEPINPASDNDDFGMDDEDDFAADLEQVASLYDTRSMQPSNKDYGTGAELNSAAITSSATAVPVISLVDDDSDEFGEDIDVDEFAAAEVAATQVSTNTVRRTQTFP